MKSQVQPSLPSGRAFIVQFHAEADIATGLFTGRVEHIVSYQATHFDSLEALVTFMARVLAVHEALVTSSRARTLPFCHRVCSDLFQVFIPVLLGTLRRAKARQKPSSEIVAEEKEMFALGTAQSQFNVRLNSYKMWKIFALFAVAALCATFAPQADAETLTYNSSSSTAEAAWSNCPNVASFDGELCNYTAVFAGRGNQFQPFFIIQMMNLAVYTNGTVQIVAAMAGYVQPAANVQVAQGTLAKATASGAVYLYGDCGDPNDLSTCIYYGVGSVSARWRASGAALRWNDTKNITEAGTKVRLQDQWRVQAINSDRICGISRWSLVPRTEPHGADNELRHQSEPDLPRCLPAFGSVRAELAHS